MTKVLVIEDDEHLAKILELELSFEQYKIVVCKDGLEGLETALNKSFDLVLVDLMLPSMNGFEIIRRIRLVDKYIGIIMMTAKDSFTDTVLALDSGADDYISKPFAIEELLARMRVVLRRNHIRDQLLQPMPKKAKAPKKQGVELDPASQMVIWNETMTKFSQREFAILQFFVKNENQLLTRRQIYTSVWGKGPKSASEMTIVDVYVRHIRNKTDKNIIKTVYGKGYIFGEIE